MALSIETHRSSKLNENERLVSGFISGLNFNCDEPTASMPICGGLITAENFVIPNMPKLDMLNVPP